MDKVEGNGYIGHRSGCPIELGTRHDSYKLGGDFCKT